MKDTNYSNNGSSSSNASASNTSNNMSFIDETKHVSMKVKVKKRNTDLNIKQSRLRKPLQNHNLLKNYFEFNKKELVTSDLTIYKIVETNNIDTNDINGNQMDTNGIDENSDNESNNRIGRNTSSDKIVTTEKIKYNPRPNNSNNSMTTSTSSSNVMNELHNNRVNINNNTILNNNNLIFNPEDYNQFFNDNLNSNLNNNINSNIDSSSPTNSSNEEFDDSQSFLSSFSFLFK